MTNKAQIIQCFRKWEWWPQDKNKIYTSYAFVLVVYERNKIIIKWIFGRYFMDFVSSIRERGALALHFWLILKFTCKPKYPEFSVNSAALFFFFNNVFLFGHHRAGEGGRSSKAWRGGDGHSGDQVWRVHVLRAARVHWPVAHLCRSGCQISTSGNDEEEGVLVYIFNNLIWRTCFKYHR